MRYPHPTIREHLRRFLEPRSPLAATCVVNEEGRHYIVLTLLPGRTFVRRGDRVWETRVYLTEPPRYALGGGLYYGATDSNRTDALARHETVVGCLERDTFAPHTARDIFWVVHPLADRAAHALDEGNQAAALAALEQGLGESARLDITRRFLHVYIELFLMRALALERSDRMAAKGAYRDLIALYAAYPINHPDTLRGVAWAREAVERLTPAPAGDLIRAVDLQPLLPEAG